MSNTYSVNNYVIDKLIVNHKQLSIGDMVGITHEGWSDLESGKFWTNTLIGGTVGLVALPVAIPAGGIGILGSGIALGVGEVAQAGIGAGIGMAVAGLGTKISQDFAKGNIPASDILQAKGFIGRVNRIDEKIFSDACHVEVCFFIPKEDGNYDTRTEWIDAHHLMKLITKDDYKVRLTDDAEKAEKELHKQALAQRALAKKELEYENTLEFQKLTMLRKERQEFLDAKGRHQTERKVHWAVHVLLCLLIIL